MQMQKKYLEDVFDKCKKEILENRTDAKQRKFRKIKDVCFKDKLYENTLIQMLGYGISKINLIEGIKNKIFDADTTHFGDDAAFIMHMAKVDKTIRYEAFSAVKDILLDVANNINDANKEETIREINNTQNMLFDLAEIREHNPQISEQTDKIYNAFTNLMHAYSVSNIYDASMHSSVTEDYFYGRDNYQQQIEADNFYNQSEADWNGKKRLEDAKQRVCNKLTQIEIRNYEQDHAEQVKQEDKQDKINRDRVLAEHDDYIRSKEHCKQINDDRLYHTEKRVIQAYENFKDVARRTEDNFEKQSEVEKEKTTLSSVPKRAVFIGRITPKNNIKE